MLRDSSILAGLLVIFSTTSPELNVMTTLKRFTLRLPFNGAFLGPNKDAPLPTAHSETKSTKIKPIFFRKYSDTP